MTTGIDPSTAAAISGAEARTQRLRTLHSKRSASIRSSREAFPAGYLP